jgi:hypothetical protein
MRLAALLPSVILVGVGALFVGQGVGAVKGSFMTGSAFWAVVGAVMVIGGIGLLVFAARRGSPKS